MAEIIYLNNELEEIVGLPKKELVSAIEYEQLNDFDYLEMTARVSPENKDILDNTNFIGLKRRGTDDHFNIYKTINTQIGRDIFIKGVNLLYDEMRGIPLNAISWDNVNVVQILTDILSDSGWQLDYITDTPPKTVEYFNFDYTDLYTAFMEVVNYFKLEYTTFYDVETRQRVVRIEQFHNEEKPVYEYIHGINSKDISKEVDTLDSYTAVVGLGKVINEETGERLKFTNVIWRKSEGNKLDKVGGQDYLEIPELTKKNSLFNGKPKKKHVIYDDVGDATILIERSYTDLVDIARPKVQYRATAISLGGLIKVGDQVVVKRTDLDIRYLTRIFRIKHNLLNENLSYAEFGDVTHTSMAKRLKNMPKPEFDTTIFDDEIQKLKKRVWDLENQAPENTRPKPLDAKYFTFNVEATHCSLTGLSELGYQAIASGEIKDSINLPEQFEGKPFKHIGQFRIGSFDGHIFVPYTYEDIGGYGTFETTQVDYIEFEDNGINSGLKTISGSYVFRGCIIRSNAIKLPPSLQEMTALTMNASQNLRFDVPQSAYDYANVRDRFKSNQFPIPYDDHLVSVEGDFLIQEEINTVVIVGLSPVGSMKNVIIVPTKIKGKAVRNIMNTTFQHYAHIKIVDMSDFELTEIPAYMFTNMENLSEVILAGAVERIGEYAFMGSSIAKITTEGISLLTHIGNRAFEGATFETFNIPDSVQSFGEYVFKDCKNLKGVDLGVNITTIPKGTFEGATALSNVEITNNIVEIGDSAFYGTGLVELFIPKTLERIGKEAFMNTYALDKVVFEDNSDVTTPFRFTGTHTFRNSSVREVVLPILYNTGGASDTFYGCTNLQFPTIPDNWTTLSPSMFVGCSGFGDLDLSVTNLSTIPSYAFHGCNLKSVTFRTDIPMVIAGYAFLGTNPFRAVTLKSGSNYSIGTRGSFANGTVVTLV